MNALEVRQYSDILHSMIEKHAASLSKDELIQNELYKKFLPKWKSDALYKFGDRVVYNDLIYTAKQTAMSGTETPDVNTDLWEKLEDEPEEWPEFVPNKPYQKGDKITWQGSHYVCTYENGIVQWDPTDFPEGWTNEQDVD